MKLKPHIYIAIVVILLNYMAINACVYMGQSFRDVSFLFQEREAITFLSALQLGFISIFSLFLYILKRILYKGNKANLKKCRIWLVSFIIFAFATADEYFMLHEGIDGDIATYLFGIKDNPHLDGFTLALYGVAALLLFLKFKDEILKYKGALVFFGIGGAFFLLSLLLDIGSIDQFQIILEESAKLLAVGFLFSGYITIFSDAVREIELRINKRGG